MSRVLPAAVATAGVKRIYGLYMRWVAMSRVVPTAVAIAVVKRTTGSRPVQCRSPEAVIGKHMRSTDALNAMSTGRQ
jgi:hypothetical protein